MTKPARSLNPRPDYALEAKEAEAERLAAQITHAQRIASDIALLAQRYGTEAICKAFARWSREHGPQVIRLPRPAKPHRAAAEALFKGSDDVR